MKRFGYACGICALIFFSGVQLGSAELPPSRQVPGSQPKIQLSFAPLVKKTVPAVVNVYAARQVRVRSPFEGDPFFEQFFGRQFPNHSRVQSSLGSGVIVDSVGLVVTNYHVIRDADEIKVALSDGHEFESKIILKDEATDIAVLRINAKEVVFPVLNLADSDKVEVGDLVIAIGNPFGVGQTVTSGIVSAQARTKLGVSDFDFFIQTDAAINPGNSGGALVDMQGDLIGVNTAIYSRTGGSIGIGFAIPSNLVRSVVEAVKHGKTNFDPPYLGVIFQGMTPDVAESLGMKQPYGVLVTDIVKNSPAEKAGLKVGDVIVTVQGVRIDNIDVFSYRLITARAREMMKLGILRNGKQFDINVAVQILSSDQAISTERIDILSPLFGVGVTNLTPLNARRFHQPSARKGVVISDVNRNLDAAVIFAKGDIIRAVNGRPVNTVDDLKRILTTERAQIWQFEYERNGILIRQFIH
ncbi:MAG: Protease Do [Candidatus Tokpelaia sp. JSC189]|nr:MAG: Protease Do [Candidatus Tokpelaia sp. JSC189]